MRLVSYPSGKVLKVYRGHKNNKFCTTGTFIPTLKPRPAVACGSEDGSIFVWDLNSKQVTIQAVYSEQSHFLVLLDSM